MTSAEIQLVAARSQRQSHAKRKVGAAIGRMLAVLATTFYTIASATTPNQSDLAKIHTRLEQLRQQSQAAETNRVHAADALQQSERSISEANRNLYELDQQHRQTQLTLARLQSQIANAHTAIQQQQTALAQLIRQQYLTGNADAIKLLMSGKDPNLTARNLIYFSYLGRARNQLISSLQQNLNQLDQLTKAAQQQQDQLQQQRQLHQQQRQILQAQRQQKQLILKQLGTEIQQQHQQIATLEQNEKRITSLLEALARAAAERKAKAAAAAASAKRNRATTHTRHFTTVPESPEHLAQPSLPDTGLGRLKGRLVIPTRGELIHRFGTPRERGGTLWKGLFIKAPAGQAVHSVADGQVVFADWLRGFGNLIIIDHGGGYMSLYSSNETLYKRVGDNVKAGDVIASVGNTGGNNETGLYFELRYQSQAFDPSNWIAR